MLQGDNSQVLTNYGIHELFSHNFKPQEFKLQIITYMPSEFTFTIFLSDGHAWIRGTLEGNAKKMALSNSQIKCFSFVSFLPDDIRMNLQSYTFELNSIRLVDTTVHNIIGEPIPYEDFKKKGLANSIPRKKIETRTTIYTLKQIKENSTGKIVGAVVAKVIKKPDKVNSVMNIMIEDENKEQIQCCFFSTIAQKYQSILKVGAWYRFEDPVLQMNNRQGCLQLKINNSSNIESVKIQGPCEQTSTVGLQKSQVKKLRAQVFPRRSEASMNESKPDYKSKQNPYPEVQFKVKNFQNCTSIEDCDYFIIARPLRINNLKGDIGRSLQCVDRYGCSIEITLWQEYAAQEILLNQTYRFTKLKGKLYKGTISLQSRKAFTRIEVSNQKIMNRKELVNPQLSFNPEPRVLLRKEKLLSMNQIIYSLIEATQKAASSKEKTCYLLAMGTLILRLQNWGNEFEFSNELRKKLFYTYCERCEANEYIRTKIQPELVNDRPTCSGCKSSNIKIMWNIKAILADSQLEIPVKINSEIVEKFIGLTPAEGFKEFLRSPEQLKRIVLEKIKLARGVFKISAKLNERKQGERFFNICQYYTDWLKVYYSRSVNELKQAEQAYLQFCAPKQAKADTAHPIPSFLSRLSNNDQLVPEASQVNAVG